MSFTARSLGKPLMRWMNSRFRGHQGVVPDRLHVARRGLLGRGIVPSKGQLNDAAREGQGIALLHNA